MIFLHPHRNSFGLNSGDGMFKIQAKEVFGQCRGIVFIVMTQN